MTARLDLKWIMTLVLKSPSSHSSPCDPILHQFLPHFVREETHYSHYMGYAFRLAARVLLYSPSHSQDSTYHGFSYNSCGAQWIHHKGSIQRPIDP